MSELLQVVVFRMEGQRYALPLAAVQRIVRAVEVTHLPGAPSIVLGAINVAGSVVPVLNLRRRLLLPERTPGLDDQFLLAQGRGRGVALVIDEAHGVFECELSDVVGADRIAQGLEQFQGVIKLEDGLVLIHDLEKFLSLDETLGLNQALERAAPC